MNRFRGCHYWIDEQIMALGGGDQISIQWSGQRDRFTQGYVRHQRRRVVEVR